MLTLNEKGLQNRSEWLEKGYTLPAFDRAAMIARTAESPAWVHFGAGNIFRAFQCAAMQKLLDAGETDTGIVAVEGFDYEIVEKGYRPCDNYTLLVTLKADGKVEKTVIGSIAESCILDSGNAAEYDHLKAIFTSPSLQMASFTITEKGYAVRDAQGNIAPAIAADLQAGPAAPQSYLGKVASLLYARYQAGALPIALVSMDNCSHNGEKLYQAIHTFAEGWKDAGFLAYVSDPGKVAFPWTMIDKITPRPDASVEAMLREDGLQGLDPVITSKHTYIAPFVNAEESEYLVIEDAFPNGRPPLEKAGFLFTDRDTVNRVERMKVTTCLNPLHTALAVYGCLLGYTSIAAEMRDPQLKTLVEHIGYDEGMPVVVDPKILSPRDFIREVLEDRLPNPFIPDAPQRIACDTSQKVGIRFGETIKSYAADPKLDAGSLTYIPLAIAGWCRYLLALDDELRPMTLSSDPMLDTLCPLLSGVKIGEDNDVHAALQPILSNPVLFGSDLYAVGLGEKIEGMFRRLTAGKGAVRETLIAYLG